MTSKLDIEIRGVLFVGLYTLVFLMAGAMNGVGQDVSSGQSESQAAHDYCVQMGNLYQTTPTLNNGQPICTFSNGAWCDANAFYKGQCSATYNPAGLPNPYATYYGYPPSSSVHTPYGDVPANAAYGSGNIYMGNPYYGGWTDPYYGGMSTAGAEQAAWMYGAMSFLNAP
ncbi:MAG: DUF333 domain-containing protein [Methanotrichaceae archaeon]|nr:DUF333 domain-containing protein [Methanotrichaceae archaeon]